MSTSAKRQHASHSRFRLELRRKRMTRAIECHARSRRDGVWRSERAGGRERGQAAWAFLALARLTFSRAARVFAARRAWVAAATRAAAFASTLVP